MGIHYDYKSTRGAKAMEKQAKREKKLAEKRAKKQAKAQEKGLVEKKTRRSNNSFRYSYHTRPFNKSR